MKNRMVSTVLLLAACVIGMAQVPTVDAFTLAKIPQWVEELGMDKKKHSELMKDASVRANVSNSKKEGLTNGVVTTPTFFLNGRKIDGAFDADSITSILEEALEYEAK